MIKRAYIYQTLFLVFLYVLQVEAVSSPSVRLLQEGLYEMKLPDQTMLVDAFCGGRIVSFKYMDKEFLTQPDVNALNYGSTLWLSPQKWGWPPPEVLDRGRYEAVINKHTLKLVSQPDPVTGCSITKAISSDQQSNSFCIQYEITNQSGQSLSYAPWEVSRVPAAGITFYPVGSPGGKSRSNLATADIEGITWFTFNPDLVDDHQKLFRNGSEGWLAHVADRFLLLKQFPDIGIEQEAPGETEVEIYVCKDKTYMELENQGPYQTLHPGESLSWTVRWYLRKLPEGIKAEQGNSELVDFVRETIRRKEMKRCKVEK